MKTHVLALIIVLCSGLAAFGQHIEENFNKKKGVAIEGYDPVSYFQDKPRPGKEEYKARYQGVEYWFSSAENQKTFKADPGHYEPQYGGWCAFAMGQSGDKVKIDPETYKILDGKLYLFYNFKNYNTLLDWNKDENNLKKEGDQRWQRIIN